MLYAGRHFRSICAFPNQLSMIQTLEQLTRSRIVEKKPLSLTFRRKTSNNFKGNNIFTLCEEQVQAKDALSPHTTWHKGWHMGGSGVTSVSFQLWPPGRESTKTPKSGLIHLPSIRALSAQQ